MTVSTTASKITYIADGATTVWSFSFAATAAGDIQVFVTDSLGHITTQPTNAYSVVLNTIVQPNPTPVGGSVTFPLTGPPLAIGNSLTIARILPETQTASISNQSIIYPSVVEQTFDRLIMIDQQVSEQIGRAISVPIGDPTPTPLPPASLRASQQAVFDINGNMTAGGAVVGTIISPVMVPVVTAATLPLAQAAMQVAPLASPALTGVPTAPTATFGDNTTQIATDAFVQAALAGAGMAMTTGDLKATHKTVADAGWILWIDGTIGDALSGSSVRSNADTSALFTLYYNGFNDTNCPLLTSAGAATTRAAQGTAAVAFAAHCRMNLPKGSSRGIGLAGTGTGLTARTPGSTFGAETVVMTIPQMPQHSHTHSWSGPLGTPSPLQAIGGGPFGNFSFAGPDSATAVDFTLNNTGTGAAMNVMNPMAYVNIMIKL